MEKKSCASCNGFLKEASDRTNRHTLYTENNRTAENDSGATISSGEQCYVICKKQEYAWCAPSRHARLCLHPCLLGMGYGFLGNRKTDWRSHFLSMRQDSITSLKIDRLAGLGDGVGLHNGKKIFVPYTTAGDVVDVRIRKKTVDADYASLEKIINPSKERATPVCKHFGECGSCALQHVSQFIYTGFKQDIAKEAVRKAGYDTACVEPLVTFPAATRRRVDLKIHNGKIGFYAGQSHRIVDMTECKVLEPELFTLVMQIKSQLSGLQDISGVQINGVDGGYDVLVDGADGGKLKLASIKRLSVRENGVIRTLYQSGDVCVTLGGFAADVPPGAFLQASRQAQELMIFLVLRGAEGAVKALDLFAGIGTYSFPLSNICTVMAIEGEKAMAQVINTTAHKHSLSSKIKAEMRDLFLNPIRHETLTLYDTVVINPPRTGAKSQSEELAKSKTARLIMVSCNPATFSRDAHMLKEGGYKLNRLTPIDQFVYSAHLELVAEFTR